MHYILIYAIIVNIQGLSAYKIQMNPEKSLAACHSHQSVLLKGLQKGAAKGVSISLDSSYCVEVK